MEEVIKDAEFTVIPTVEEPREVVLQQDVDTIKEELMKKILGESVAVSVGNFIFIPPLANPVVTNPERTIKAMSQSNYMEGYVKTSITVDDKPISLLTHISRIAHEGQPPSVSIIDVDKFSESDLKITFKNEFPKLFTKTVELLLEHKKTLTYKDN
jgi:hypothetical protein